MATPLEKLWLVLRGARRRVVAPLLELLQLGHVDSLLLEAAAALADPVLLPRLQQIQAQWNGKQEWPCQILEEAIVACTSPTRD